MTQELIYTSAPQGLRPGSRGFCTVVSTQGMAVNLAERLESLSAYRHVFAPQDPNAGLNPIVYSHIRIAVGGRQYHVLSRIAAAGLDYTQRTNKFAHHVVLDAGELTSGGPAWLLAQPEFMQSQWDGQPKVLPSGRRPLTGSLEPGICRNWQSVTGDAGWAGILAESAIEGTKSVVTIIYQPGMEILPLVAEAMSLLPAQRRWEISFSTYYTKLPPGIDCMWRFALQGSPEAQAASRIPGTVIIDLCRPLERAVTGPLVKAARTGQLPVVEHKSELVSPVVSDRISAATGQSENTGRREEVAIAPVAPPQRLNGDYGLVPPPTRKPLALADRPPIQWQPQRKRPMRWPWIAAIGATIFMLAAGMGISLWLTTVGPKIGAALSADNSPIEDSSPTRSSTDAPTTSSIIATTTQPEQKTYEDAFAVLQTMLGEASQPKYKKLESMQQEIAQIRQEMELSAQKKEFKLALQQCNDLRTKVNAYTAALKDLENRKKIYEDALTLLQSKLGEASKPKYKKLEAMQQEIAQVRTEMELSAQNEDYDRAQQHCSDLGTKVDAYTAALQDLENKKKIYEDALLVLQPKLAGLVPLPQEIEAAKRQMESAAKVEEYEQALNYVNDLTTKADLHNVVTPSVEIVQKKNPQEYQDRITVHAITAETAQPISLRLVHPKLAKGLFYRLSPSHTADGMSAWDVSAGPQDSTPFARFELTQSELRFKWAGEAARQPTCRALRNCLLQVDTDPAIKAGTARQLLLRKPIEFEPVAIGESKGAPIVRQLRFDDMWPSVPIKLANIRCDAPDSNLKDADIVAIGNGVGKDGTLFFQLVLNSASPSENEFVRKCDVVIDYLGVSLPNNLPSGGTGPETNSEFHTRKILESQIPDWINRIDTTIGQKQNKIDEVKKMQVDKSRGDKRDYEGEIAEFQKGIDRLNEERALVTGTFSVNLEKAKAAHINFEICFEVQYEGRVRDMPLARTKTKHGE